VIKVNFKIPFNSPAKEFNDAMSKTFPNIIKLEDLVFICIGTDRSTGDSLGPWIGTGLKKAGYKNVYGDLDNPVHAINLKDTQSLIQKVHMGKTIIAFDACLGQVASVGHIHIASGPVKPGAGVNKNLGEVGDFHINGVVNVGGFMEYFVLQNTRLNLVVKMAEVIINAIQNRFPLWVEVVKDEERDRARKESAAAYQRINDMVEEEEMESSNPRKEVNISIIGD
jgi:putative sporulation protein YyaC